MDGQGATTLLGMAGWSSQACEYYRKQLKDLRGAARKTADNVVAAVAGWHVESDWDYGKSTLFRERPNESGETDARS